VVLVAVVVVMVVVVVVEFVQTDKYNVCLQLPATVTRMLLSHFKWDRERLMERYESMNCAALFCGFIINNVF